MVSTKPIKRFEIYWADLDPTRGSEMRKTRPCVVVSSNEMNEVLRTVMVVPLTSTIIGWPFRFTSNSTAKQSSAACDQLRSIAKERLGRKIGFLAPAEQDLILEILRSIFNR